MGHYPFSIYKLIPSRVFVAAAYTTVSARNRARDFCLWGCDAVEVWDNALNRPIFSVTKLDNGHLQEHAIDENETTAANKE